MIALLLLALASPSCTRHTVKVVAEDANGAPLVYETPYWLCEPGAVPAAKPVIMVCYEGGNPYARELWAHPADKPDVGWLCTTP
jgi:hypothetical protein